MATITGMQGVVRFGPVDAATLRSWTLARDDDQRGRWKLTATAVAVNRFYITQAPLSVSLRVGSRQWRWHDVVLEIAGQTVTGTVSGRPEVK